jgi:hypothetical protein
LLALLRRARQHSELFEKQNSETRSSAFRAFSSEVETGSR